MDELLNTFMKFKSWFKESTVGTAVLHGGIGEMPGDDNHNMPVRSKWTTNDGSTPKQKEISKSPDDTFGFNKEDKKKSKKRKTNDINNNNRFPLNTGNPASIGFSRY